MSRPRRAPWMLALLISLLAAPVRAGDKELSLEWGVPAEGPVRLYHVRVEAQSGGDLGVSRRAGFAVAPEDLEVGPQGSATARLRRLGVESMEDTSRSRCSKACTGAS